MAFTLGHRRGTYCDITDEMKGKKPPVSAGQVKLLEEFDLIYRTLCTLLFNYVPASGHPGGSISAGRFVAGLLFGSMDYDVSHPEREDADIISFAAGHKALGLYSLWAMRNEALRIARARASSRGGAAPDPTGRPPGISEEPDHENPSSQEAPREGPGRPSDAGHPLRPSLDRRLGRGHGELDRACPGGPRLLRRKCAACPHRRRGRGDDAGPGQRGPGCRGNLLAPKRDPPRRLEPGFDRQQPRLPRRRPRAIMSSGRRWSWPTSMTGMSILVPEGRDLQQIFAAQRKALEMDNGQPTAIVYRTVKGWQYGIEGKASHGAGHKLCADGFFEALKPFLKDPGVRSRDVKSAAQRCRGGKEPGILEECFWESLKVVRTELERNRRIGGDDRREARWRRGSGSNRRCREPRSGGPRIEAVYEIARQSRQDDRRKSLR